MVTSSSSSDTWDPLEVRSDTSGEILEASQKREIRNILKSYVGIYDPFSELIQNSMDAVDERAKNEGESYQKKIWITIALEDGLISVTDNGIGFSEDEFQKFLSPNISFKDEQDSRGKKGVGATYLAYGFNHLQIGTKTDEYEKVAEIKNGRRWVEDQSNEIDRPKVQEANVIHNKFEEIERGSTFTIELVGENIRPKDLSWPGAYNADQWESVLQIKTPLGHLDFNGNPSDVDYEIEVISDDGITECQGDDASYIYPHTVIQASKDLEDILEKQQELIEANEDPSELPSSFQNLNGIYKFWSTEELLEKKNWNQEEEGPDEKGELLREHSVCAYSYFGYSTQLWDTYNDEELGLREGFRVLRGGLQLSTKNMPQGELVTIPLTSNIGYQKQAHVIVHFDDADPDLGRKGFQPELKELAEDISVALVNHLKKRRGLLKHDTGRTADIQERGELHEWMRDQEEHEDNQPLQIENQEYFIPLQEVSITSEPSSEQDVVSLFNQFLAGGVIRGIKLMACSTHEKYDGLFRYRIDEPFEHHVFDEENNPLGIQEANEPLISRQPFVLEYKYSINALIRQFNNDEKRTDDIDLAVAWEMGDNWRTLFKTVPLLDPENLQHRKVHGLSHLFIDERNNSHAMDVIILKDIVNYLSNPESETRRQREKYNSE